MSPRIQTVIMSARQAFENKFGRAPNTLLVSADGEMALNEMRIKPGMQYMGMTVICAEVNEDATVALILRTP